MCVKTSRITRLTAEIGSGDSDEMKRGKNSHLTQRGVHAQRSWGRYILSGPRTNLF